jgi:NADP-dependent 3-hydroxy acid dehydrogenase YdfG
MTQIRDNTILITGGASGIGKLMGMQALQKGVGKLMIRDINRQNLQQVTDELQEQEHQVAFCEVDITQSSSMQAAAMRVLQETGPPDILINNAGILVGKPFVEHSFAEIERTLYISLEPWPLRVCFCRVDSARSRPHSHHCHGCHPHTQPAHERVLGK